MIRSSILAVPLIGLAACVSQDQEAEMPYPEMARAAVETVTMEGRTYDLVYDRYAPETATIYGVSETASDLLWRDIVAEAAPCPPSSMTVLANDTVEHPDRDDLEALRSVPLSC